MVKLQLHFFIVAFSKSGQFGIHVEIKDPEGSSAICTALSGRPRLEETFQHKNSDYAEITTQSPGIHSSQTSLPCPTSCKCRRPLSCKDPPLLVLRHAVRKREFEIFCNELFDVWSLDLIRVLEFDNFQDLACR